jgi:hypothetical protein
VLARVFEALQQEQIIRLKIEVRDDVRYGKMWKEAGTGV